MVDVTLLGTAALAPIPDRALTAAVVRCGGGCVLIDCGEGTQTAFRKAGISPMKIDLIALTHYHGDHIFGLPGLLQTLFVMGRTRPLFITGPRGLYRAMEPILRLAGALTFDIILLDEVQNGINLHELFPDIYYPGKIYPFDTLHRVPSCGYRFDFPRSGKFLREKAEALEIPVRYWSRLQKGETIIHEGKTYAPEAVTGEKRKGIRFVFSGDTSPCPSLTQAAENADLFVCEATYPSDEYTDTALERGHMTFIQAAQSAKDANAKALCLVHFSQIITEPEEFLPAARETFDNTVCGCDNMTFHLAFDD